MLLHLLINLLLQQLPQLPSADGAVHITLGSAVVTLIGKTIFDEIRNSNRRPKTFADDQDAYWRRMREVVTDPISEVLREQTQANIRVLTELARIEGAQSARAGK